MQSHSWEQKFRKNLLASYTGKVFSTIKTKATFLLRMLVNIYVTRRRRVRKDYILFDSQRREYPYVTVLSLICSKQMLEYYFNHNTAISSNVLCKLLFLIT